MSKLFTFLLILLFIPALAWGGMNTWQVYHTGFGAFTVSHTKTVEMFTSPMLKATLIIAFQSSIALFILGIIAYFTKRVFLGNTGFALGVGIAAGIILIGVIQYHHVKELLSSIPPAPNISSREYSTESDTNQDLFFVYAFTWQKGSSIPQEIQMYKTIMQFYQAYFSSAYYMNFHLTTVPSKRCVDGIDDAYDLWLKQKHSTTDTFSVTCKAEANDLHIKAITLYPGDGVITFK